MAIVGKWGLNGNANDLVGSNNLTATNVSLYPLGKSGTSASLNGTSSRIDGAIPTQTNNTDFTMFVWIKRTGTGSGANSSIVQAQNGTSVARFALWINSSNQIGGFNDGGGALTYTSTVPELNVWERYVITRNSTTVEVFKNGVSITSQAKSTSDGGNVINYLRIGARENVAEFFNGTVDEVQCYNTVVSKASIKNDFAFYQGFI